jgi:hypothetical protein
VLSSNRELEGLGKTRGAAVSHSLECRLKRYASPAYLEIGPLHVVGRQDAALPMPWVVGCHHYEPQPEQHQRCPHTCTTPV